MRGRKVLESQTPLQTQSNSEKGDIIYLQKTELVFAVVESKKHPDKRYNVFYNTFNGVASCECNGWFFNGNCWHVKALLTHLNLPTADVQYLQAEPVPH
jgi:hypothetical protein